MNHSRFLRAAIGLASVGALLLSACGSDTAPAGDGGSGSTIVYVVPSSWTKLGALTANIDAWEAKTGNTVELQAIPDEQYDSTVRARLQGGEGIDIYAGQDSVEDKAAIMLAADESLFASRMAESVLESMRSEDGKIYSYPGADALSSFGLFYNKDVFEAAGVTQLPTTLTELTDAFTRIDATGKAPLSLSGAEGWTLLQHRNSVNANLLGEDPEVAAKLASNATTWADIPGVTQQYEALEGWAKAGLLNDDALTASYEGVITAVANGETGAIINGSWVLGEIRKQNPDANVGFLALPTASGKNTIALSTPQMMHIAAKTKVADQAKDLLVFLGEAPQVEKNLELSPGVPAFTDVTVKGDEPVIADINAYVTDGHVGLAFDTATTFPTPEADLIAAYQELLAGRIDAAGFVQQVDTAWANAGATAGREGF